MTVASGKSSARGFEFFFPELFSLSPGLFMKASSVDFWCEDEVVNFDLFAGSPSTNFLAMDSGKREVTIACDFT
eukprot:CAMPEP_0176023988 /NCGR_PEP_ID=MMETSP0120_2-20121206/11713_1 /TAXON_ID=160619 /ORGANISM="Kryptoperidinium foliaceum, Strain CCMP 1326" /LENGTH=73 /DNA_ID=CAMNT_0017357159 /DNA_START=102 /DNA_END=319 /DNA_ORIENTATION=-